MSGTIPLWAGASGAPRRILLATTGLYKGGGIASVSRCIARTFEEEREQGRLDAFDTVSHADEPGGPVPSSYGRHERASGSQLRFVYQLWRTLLRRRPDLVLFDHAGLARAMRLPLPGIRGVAYGIFGHGPEIHAVAGGARTRAVMGARRIITNSEFTARQFRERFPDLSERVRTAPLCIDPELIEQWSSDPGEPPARREPAVLIVGRLWSTERGKGHDALIAAMPRVRERVPDAELWIVGTGDDQERLEREARERGLGDAVRFLGGISVEELGRLYRTASVYAMPSRQEGFGLVYAEAMWHGLPCVGSTLDAAGDVISDGETGLLVPYGEAEPLTEALTGLLSDPERLARMGAAAADSARRRFTYERFRADLLRALDLGDPSPGSGSAPGPA